ncbi:MAG: 50S ribosomal protein L13 [Pseudomonadota bacterium]|nr:50S ribosomal protein L13 [Pseudomonadota bacterium]
MNTYNIKQTDVKKNWILINADGLVLGRLATHIAAIVRGKNKPIYTPHVDCGDNVIVINAEKVHLTGLKRDKKTYYWHTGYPGGIKSKSASDILDGKFPERVIIKAVQRMLPGGPLSRRQLKNLKVYPGSEHPHQAQQPVIDDFASQNLKNTRRA